MFLRVYCLTVKPLSWSKPPPTNILVLQNNTNTDTFYQEQVDKIMSYNPPLPKPDEDEDSPTPVKRIRKASLLTKTKLPITNAEDIERYLEGLRQQLESCWLTRMA